MAVKSEDAEAGQSNLRNCGPVKYLSIVGYIPTHGKNKCFLMHVAKYLVLLAFNVKKECKMLINCFINAQFVSISMHLGK